MRTLTKIHELSDVLTDQIAAGEVIERPASVVKELVENAIDAHSLEIDITLEEAGLQKIEVRDDGDGISTDEVLTAFKRHATSKITDRKDLFRVKSLGFRGEALPSIASVSNVTMVTSTGKTGAAVTIKGGELVTQKPAEARRGTTVTVADLFYNVPARLKYLKSPNTELSKIVDIVNRLAFGHPEISIALTHNGRELLRTAGRGDQLQVIGSVYGMAATGQMAPIKASDADFKISGYVSLPALTRASRSYISVLLNGRYVRNFAITKAVIAGYGSKLMVGRYPLAVINIEMDPLLVDVNVHPTKQEVRLSKEEALSHLVRTAVAAALGDRNLIPDGWDNLNKRAEKPVDLRVMSQALTAVSRGQERVSAAIQPEKKAPVAAPDNGQEDRHQPVTIRSRQDLKSPSMAQFESKYKNEVVRPFGESNFIEPAATSGVSQETELLQAPTTERFPTLSYIGQFHGTYLLAEAPDGLYMLDQHAAQERVNYEYYRQKIGEVADDQQRLLVPIVIDYSTSDMLKIRDHTDTLASVGLHVELFGSNSIVIHQHPTWFKAGQEEDTVKEMIDWVLRDGRLTVAQFREKTAIMMSCKRAIKANHHLDNRQAKALLTKLATAENPFNCPHGRPVLVHFTDTDMEKLFKRIQDAHESAL
ncbi:DNA mismatch repair protein [Secundilactobacillus kimchicus JCM 15530]|uniref:DNA mismatch repair protein MutL n=1 Tax=Secundilactobacillus kimchicus JCM 15530 TaxID=1302272 RepID=A0A0R1HP50_9LACO|nr:DNA mismatch repair protein [Secundilactobacillus kimchicus JCM 15530]